MANLIIFFINLILFILTLILIFFIFMLVQFLWGAPFEPSKRKIVKKMISLAGNLKGKKAVDLGSGDGRIPLSLEEAGAKAYGIEINPYLVLFSRIKFFILKSNVKIKLNSFWKENLKDYDVIMLFQVDYIMEKLGNKIKKECKPGTKIISHHWKFPNLKLKKEIDDIYVYEV